MKTERLQVLDALRGFSLFGILLLHITMFQYPTLEAMQSLPKFDSMLSKMVDIFASNSFRPLFSFMFGVGFIILLRSLERRGLRVQFIFFRRFLLLFAIGFAHYMYLWTGDILSTYGAGGILLLFFLRRQPKTWLVWAMFLWLAAPVVSLLFRPIGLIQEPMSHVMDLTKLIDPSLWDHTRSLFTALWGSATEVLPFFLLGMYAMQINLFQRLEDNRTRNGLLALVFLTIGLPIKAILYMTGSYEAWADLIRIGNGAAMLGYLFAIMYLFTTRMGKRFFEPFQAVGKMSLTNYLSHTIIFTLLFIPAGILFKGIGLIQPLGVFWGLLIACVTIVLQARFSNWWLSRFTYGPIEWLWRMFTYWKWTPIRKCTTSQNTVPTTAPPTSTAASAAANQRS